MVIGGWDGNAYRSVEAIGFDNCSVPDLPEWRHHHGSFITSWGSLAVCGGWWSGKPASSDCLVLNTTTRQWERGILGGLLGGLDLVSGYVRGVVTLHVGTYMVHAKTTSFLPSGEREWIAGPKPPLNVQCATGISVDSFLAFIGTSVRQFDSRTSGPTSDQGWVPEGVWPDLLVERQRPGCATVGELCIVAGGRNTLGETLGSVEIIFLASKSLGKANDMLKPRSHFNLVVLGKTLLAIGGNNETSIEVWEGLEEPWTLASESLSSSKRFFSALVVNDRVCSEGPLPPHTCPTLDGGTCVFPFRNGIKVPSTTLHCISFIQDLNSTALVLRTRTADIGVQQQQMNEHNVTHKNAL